jgi:hypothetical protein
MYLHGVCSSTGRAPLCGSGGCGIVARQTPHSLERHLSNVGILTGKRGLVYMKIYLLGGGTCDMLRVFYPV